MRILTILFLLLVLLPVQTFSSPNHEKIEADISIETEQVLFDLSNIKPGDTMSREFIVTNSGKKDFDYVVTNMFSSGSEKLYEQLDLRIEDQNKVLFEGKVKDFSELEPIPLKSQQRDVLLVHIAIPIELGNEFQGLVTSFEFKVFVRGVLGGVFEEGPILPFTFTNMFNFIAIGAVLLLFGLLVPVTTRKFLFHRNVSRGFR